MGIILSLAIFFSAVIIHEYSHAFIANKLGDPTAKNRGRLTLNPIAHIDPFGTVLLPLFLIAMRSPVLFGWAKPVPISFSNLKNPKRDMIWVGMAGPAANFIFAFLASILLKTGIFSNSLAISLIQSLIIINVVLSVFNLIPLPPLDGSRVLMGLLPMPFAANYARLEPYGFIILFALLYMGIFDKVIWPIATMIINLFFSI
ncbi:MAG TPA: site-2 protease family protein [Candidatus Omnitrophota bacterium]|nr:site-2 protease family protein [Candidatus Omnitrophota bacterium]